MFLEIFFLKNYLSSASKSSAFLVLILLDLLFNMSNFSAADNLGLLSPFSEATESKGLANLYVLTRSET